ncbi:hypothetical protein GCM10010259_32320 [Streptomyces daghestanicus]|uniref:Uncharacterized protein n=1 Tax=Streptomyces daghestanicus TaxID=66885 RepID=A0ABQ3Q0J3_9ACTN|nr:hypothetical protein GCM10010259_32320 [Streptomyces daghestanicus]GHI30791.1 hypothetical protein Sdagh_25210 [Streptomyces daghestanicus]
MTAGPGPPSPDPRTGPGRAASSHAGRAESLSLSGVLASQRPYRREHRRQQQERPRPRHRRAPLVNAKTAPDGERLAEGLRRVIEAARATGGAP